MPNQVRDSYRALECPFCGSALAHEDVVLNTGGNRRFFSCQGCNAQGPWSTRSAGPLELWNKRPQNAAPQVPEVREAPGNPIASSPAVAAQTGCVGDVRNVPPAGPCERDKIIEECAKVCIAMYAKEPASRRTDMLLEVASRIRELKRLTGSNSDG